MSSVWSTCNKCDREYRIGEFDEKGQLEINWSKFRCPWCGYEHTMGEHVYIFARRKTAVSAHSEGEQK